MCSRDDSAFRKRTLSLTQRGRHKKGIFSSLKGLDTLARKGKEKRSSITQVNVSARRDRRPGWGGGRGETLVAARRKCSSSVKNDVKVGSKERSLSQHGRFSQTTCTRCAFSLRHSQKRGTGSLLTSGVLRNTKMTPGEESTLFIAFATSIYLPCRFRLKINV